MNLCGFRREPHVQVCLPVARRITFVLLLFSTFWQCIAYAQDLEPRRWSHLPVGQNIIGLGYVNSDAFVYFNPVLEIENSTAKTDSFAFSAIHTFGLAGKSARFSLLLPYQSGRWEGTTGEGFQVVRRQGFGDPRLRLSVNLYGAPALKGEQYRQYRAEHTSNTVVGASLAVTLPLGQYIEDRLINIGNNRWSARPQFGVVHSNGPWSFELTGSLFLFGNNNKFIDQTVLKQNKVYALQTHVVYNFRPGLWASISTGYGSGGRIIIDQTRTAFELDNWLWAASMGFPLGKLQSLKLTWLSGRTQNDVGRDSDNVMLSWSMRWQK